MKKIFGFILLFFISLVSGQEYLRYEYVNKGEEVEFYKGDVWNKQRKIKSSCKYHRGTK